MNGILLPKLFWPTLRKNCSRELIEKKLEQFIQTVKGQNNFWQPNAFLNCSSRFLRSNKLYKTIVIKIGEKIVIDLETCRKSYKVILSNFLVLRLQYFKMMPMNAWKNQAQKLLLIHNWIYFHLLPWAAHLAKNWRSISEIGLRHPLLYLLCEYKYGVKCKE